ncbi:hypothetical protein B0T14DRAFT_563805 [Immersiella caudata]|uniref:Follistatin-like domain-containing protein n=1 Tax=Immersiella caudata TaxID=314043 RepID=A0AA39WVK3_9PEZI|nr:hypothetical protein B0T14DRAFT_563805 [Immersiella caudata]
MVHFISYQFLVAIMALSITAMPIFEDPCKDVICPKGQRCMAPIDMPECFPDPDGFPDPDPFPGIHDPCSGFICPAGKHCLALDDMPRCYLIIPTLGGPETFPTHDPCLTIDCPKGTTCIAPTGLPFCFHSWPPEEDSTPFPFPMKRRESVPENVGPCPPDAVCPQGHGCIEVNGVPNCIDPKRALAHLEPIGIDLCRLMLCGPDEFCQMVGRTAKCAKLPSLFPGGTVTPTPDLNPRSGSTCAVITCADGYSCEEPEGLGGRPVCAPTDPISDIITIPDNACEMITCADGYCKVVDGGPECVSWGLEVLPDEVEGFVDE